MCFVRCRCKVSAEVKAEDVLFKMGWSWDEINCEWFCPICTNEIEKEDGE